MVVDLTGDEPLVAANDAELLVTVAVDDSVEQAVVILPMEDDAADIYGCEASFDHDGTETAEEPDDDDEGDGDSDSDEDGSSDSNPFRLVAAVAVPPPPPPAPAPPAAPVPGRGPPLSALGAVTQIVNFYISESDVSIHMTGR
jgi:hypothetical protein